MAAAIHDVHADQIDEHAARLAYHYREAGDLRADGPAYVWSMRAGRRAGQLLAYEEAEDQYRAAARIAEEDGDVSRRITAELELSEVLTRSGRPNTGHEIASAAAAEASVWKCRSTRSLPPSLRPTVPARRHSGCRRRC